MSHEFDDQRRVHVHRDGRGVPRNLVHIDEPYVTSARTPQLAAREYLEKFGSLLDIRQEQLHHLGLPPAITPISASLEYRFLDEKVQFDSVALVFAQTYLGLPIREAGLAINMRGDPLQVVSAQSTSHSDVDLTPPTEGAVTRLTKLNARALARHLGIAENRHEFLPTSLLIKSLKLIIYRFDATRRAPARDSAEVHGQHALELVLPLPPVPETIRDGRHYVAGEIVFVLGTERIPDLHWIGIIDAETLAVLFVQPLIDDVNGLVFREDPMTVAGGRYQMGRPPSSTPYARRRCCEASRRRWAATTR